MTQKELNFILLVHKEWLSSAGKRGTRADLADEDLSYTDLTGSDLSYATLTNARLPYANLSHANLSYAKLAYTNLTGANLTYANLTNAELPYANLTDINLTNANLTHANLSGNCKFSINGNRHPIAMVNKYLSIGCYTKTIPEWEKTYLEIAAKHDYSSSDIEKYRKIIYGMIQLLDQF